MSPDGPAAPAPPASRLVAGVAVLGAVVLLAGVAVSSRGADPATFTTRVAATSAGALVVTPDGSHPAVRGEALPRGAQLRTAAGTAALSTRGRRVLLGRGTAVTVVDGARQTLGEGSALVEAGRGPALVLSTASTVLSVPSGGTARLDGGDVLRVASYGGTATVGVPGRRARTTVRPLFQLEVPAGSTPGQPTPLALTDGDAWEQAVLPQVVANDALLTGYAAMFADPGSVVAARLPSVEDESDTLRAERGVALALAGGDARSATYGRALGYRADGGSWGVVAKLVSTSLSDAERYYAALSGPAAQEVLAAGTDPSDVVVPGFDAPAPAASSPSAAGSDDTSAVPSSGPRPRPRPSASAGASPAPTPAPLGGVVPEPVASVLAPVLELLPVPLLPTPSASPPRLPVVGPVLDGTLVGGLLTPAPVTR